MTIEQADVIDIATIDHASGDLWLTISDHLPWGEIEGEHLVLLQNKLNAYLGAIESGEIFSKVPGARGRNIVIDIAGKFPPTPMANLFLQKARAFIEDAGFRLQYRHSPPD
jgi:hypothetical protein